MLTELKTYSSWREAPTLALDEAGRAETDLIQIRNIDGLDPVKASVGVSGFGAVDGGAYTGSSVLARNIVLTVAPNPDWDTWTYESLRKLLYSYFMPKRPVQLVFYSDDMVTVEITGIVESVSINMFSKDPELLVSIICPDPYFTALEPTVIVGTSIRSDGEPTVIEYKGSVESGIYLKVSSSTGPDPNVIGVQIGDPAVSFYVTDAETDATKYFELSSVPMNKFVQNVSITDGVITNLLSQVREDEGSEWPVLEPNESAFSVITNDGVQDWELTFFERFGGL